MIIKPYGKWWQHLLRLDFYMMFRAIFGWKRKGPYGSAMMLDNLGLVIESEE